VVERNAVQKDADALKKNAAAVAAIAKQEKIENKNKKSKKSKLMGKKVVIDEEDKSIQNHANTEYRLSIKLDENKKDLSQERDDNTEKTMDNNDISHEDEIISMPQIRDSIASSTKSAVRQRSIKEKVLLPIAYAILASSMATINTLFAKVIFLSFLFSKLKTFYTFN
jgi:hypothetical protein